jgi:hypothetical protein
MRSFITCSTTGKIKSRMMRWEGHVAQMGEKKKGYVLLAGKPKGKETTRKTKM